MAIRIPPLEEGTRVRVVEAELPLDPALRGREGTVLGTSAYHTHRIGVVLDGESTERQFARAELEVVVAPELAPERKQARQRRALP